MYSKGFVRMNKGMFCYPIYKIEDHESQSPKELDFLIQTLVPDSHKFLFFFLCQL